MNSIAVGIGPDIPIIFRIAYNPTTQIIYAVADIALSSLNRDPTELHFSIWTVCLSALIVAFIFPYHLLHSLMLFQYGGYWGARACQQVYYDSYPSAFLRRVPTAGTWLPFASVSTISSCMDFGLKFHETAEYAVPTSAVEDEPYGILTLRYLAEPFSIWLPMGPDVDMTSAASVCATSSKSKHLWYLLTCWLQLTPSDSMIITNVHIINYAC